MAVSSAPSVLRVSAALLLALALFTALPSAHPARAATLTVANLNDSGDGSLRHAIGVAAPGDTITFSVSGMITLTTGELRIDKNLTINGTGSATTIIDGGGTYRVFHILADSGAVAISDVTIRNGKPDVTSAHGIGGGVLVDTGTLTLARSIVSGNIADAGGGIANLSTLNLEESFVDNNQALMVNSSDGGGGIFNTSGGTLTAIESTISHNSALSGAGISNQHQSKLSLTNSTIAQNYGDGIANVQSSVSLTNVTISNSSAANGAGINNYVCADCFGGFTLKDTIVDDVNGDCLGTAVTSAGHNLDTDSKCHLTGPADISGVDPMLLSLADNGGPTETQALDTASPAIDVGSSDCPPPATDQRGISRPQGPACDIGAFEFGSAPLGTSRIWGDGDCSGDIGPRDAQAVLKNVLVQNPLSQTQPCPAVGATVTIGGVSYIWSDWDCGGDIGPRDAQAVLKNVLVQNPLSQTQPCPAVGSTVQVVG